MEFTFKLFDDHDIKIISIQISYLFMKLKIIRTNERWEIIFGMYYNILFKSIPPVKIIIKKHLLTSPINIKRIIKEGTRRVQVKWDTKSSCPTTATVLYTKIQNGYVDFIYVWVNPTNPFYIKTLNNNKNLTCLYTQTVREAISNLTPLCHEILQQQCN